jgi:hypothetical protein
MVIDFVMLCVDHASLILPFAKRIFIAWVLGHALPVFLSR